MRLTFAREILFVLPLLALTLVPPVSAQETPLALGLQDAIRMAVEASSRIKSRCGLVSMRIISAITLPSPDSLKLTSFPTIDLASLS